MFKVEFSLGADIYEGSSIPGSRHTWVEFVVGSRACFERFFRCTPVLPTQPNQSGKRGPQLLIRVKNTLTLK